jgi:hypothetical protein
MPVDCERRKKGRAFWGDGSPATFSEVVVLVRPGQANSPVFRGRSEGSGKLGFQTLSRVSRHFWMEGTDDPLRE